MADKEIGDLTAAGTLTGAELVHVVKGGNSRQTTAQDVANLAPAGASALSELSDVDVSGGIPDGYVLKYDASQGKWYPSLDENTGGAPIRTVTGTSDTPTLADAQGYIRCTSGSAVTLTIPPNSSVAFPINTVISVEMAGAGGVTLTAGAGVTLNSRGGLLALAGQYAVAQIKKVATNTWTVIGDVA